MPGLAAETLRLASGASSYLIEGEPPTLVLGNRRVALSRDGMLRLVPVAAWRRVARTLSAVDVLEGLADGGRLAGALVLLRHAVEGMFSESEEELARLFAARAGAASLKT